MDIGICAPFERSRAVANFCLRVQPLLGRSGPADWTTVSHTAWVATELYRTACGPGSQCHASDVRRRWACGKIIGCWRAEAIREAPGSRSGKSQAAQPDS